ncbi:MAG: hypothetical protein JNK45_06280 [Myxococcales bacterium]|nr:hypothetical protein [Myxococcales bacterium]
MTRRPRHDSQGWFESFASIPPSQDDDFFTALMGEAGRGPERRPSVTRPRSVRAAELFDRVARGEAMPAEFVLVPEEGDAWRVVAPPRAAVAPQALRTGDLVLRRGLGEGRLTTAHVLGEQLDATRLFAPDGRLRGDTLVLRLAGVGDPPARAAEDAELDEAFPEPVGAAVMWNNGKAFFFKGDEYVRYSVAEDWADEGYPAKISVGWSGLWGAGIDAAVMWTDGRAYFFKGDETMAYSVAGDRVEPGYPKKIKDEFPGLWERGIDAAVAWTNGRAYFFKGDEYVACSLADKRVLPDYPKKIEDHWPGLWKRDVKAGIRWNDEAVYFFKGRQYMRFSIAKDRVEPGYPRSIKGNWPSRPWTWLPKASRTGVARATRGNFPARPTGAVSGSAFMQSIGGMKRPTDWQARERAIFKQIVAGNVPDALASRALVPVELSVTRGAQTITGKVFVMPDYLCVGDDRDYAYVPMDKITAQRVAFELDMNLPTARIGHAIYLAAGRVASNRQLAAIERDYWRAPGTRQAVPPSVANADQNSTAAYAEHSDAIRERMRTRGLSLGDFVAGHKKDVVVSLGLVANDQRVAFHGFYDAGGVPFEPCREPGASLPGCKERPSHAHAPDARFCDYAQGVRLVSDAMEVDGKPMSMRAVLADPTLAWLLSSEGPISPPYIPEPAATLLARSAWESEEATGTATPTTVTIPAASGLGTAATTSPIATVSPQRQMIELLDDEVILIAKARILATWIDRRLSAGVAEALADAALMQQLDLSRDAALMARLRPWPQAAVPDRRGQLLPDDAFLRARLGRPDAAAMDRLLRAMHGWGLVILPGIAAQPSAYTRILANISRVEARLERARFDATAPRIEQFVAAFKQRVVDGRLADDVIEREVMPRDWSPSLADDLRRLAKPVVELLRRLRARNSAWTVGLYPRHWWNEFSADIYLKSGLDARQFYQGAAVRTFMDDLDAACRDAAAPGQFAWKAIYNDAPLRTELDAKFGVGRVLSAPKHGPGADIHIHLDLRPLTVTLDERAGFAVRDGRIVVR